MLEVAKLEPVDLRSVWPNEAQHFTPWLAENLDGLGGALGMDLEFVQQEAPVGPFSADILARDVNDNRSVIIENQLEATNHDHLGKVLTYAAGYNAGVMVWIVREFKDEHRQALDWLNQRTAEDTEFYGVEVRAVRIGDSSPAYVFDVVARPSTFRKINVDRIGRPRVSPSGQAYQAFWQGIVDRLRDDHTLTKARKADRYNWMNFATGVPGVVYGVVFPRKGARTELYLNSQSPSRNKALFDRLNSQGDIESAFGEPFEWERLNHARSSRIAVYLPGRTISDNEEILSDTADWMVNTVVKLSKTVVPIVKKVAEEVDEEMEVAASTPSLTDSDDTDILDYDQDDDEE